ncbi:CsbD family protein [Kribbella sp. NPDC051587]|uniref:CsbD family protein n=1 Tax=Kribbella sp. NPDC051587 TaxID=3364119 RepID=UPI0037B80CCB
MSITDKLKNQVQETVGKAKEKVGEVTGNTDLQAQGKADQSEAGLRQAAQNLQSGVANAADAVKNALSKH